MLARPPRRTTISALLICKNEADRIEPCLASIAGWVDEIIVFDSGSSDGTVEIARRYTDKVWVTDWPGYGPQRNRALAQCACDWVLTIDADERMTPALRDEADRALDVPGQDWTMLKVPWATLLFGRVLRHGRYTAPQGKLFRRQGARFRDTQVHEALVMEQPKIGVLKATMLHDSWRGYRHVQEKHLDYGCLLAEQKFAKGERASLPYAALRFVTDFLHQYVLRLGFLDGSRGFLMALVLGQYAFHKYAALWALEHQPRRDPGQPAA